MRWMLLWAVAEAASGMSTNRDGSAVAFEFEGKIIRWRPGVGADLIGDRDREAQTLPPVPARTSYFQLSDPAMGDGAVRYAARAFCTNRCTVASLLLLVAVEVAADGTSREIPLESVSSNGRYRRVVWESSLEAAVIELHRETRQVFRHRTGSFSSADGLPLSGRLVADDGTVVLSRGQVAVQGGEIVNLGSGPVALTDAGNAIYARGQEIRQRRFASGEDVLMHRMRANVTSLDIVPDGTAAIAATADGEAAVWTASGVTPLTSHLAREVAIAAGGRMAYVLRSDGTLLRFDLAEKRMERIVWVPLARAAAEGVAGSQLRLAGTGFSNAAGLRVYVDGLRAPVVALFPGELRFQIPWEVAGRTGETVEVSIESEGREPVRSRLKLAPPRVEFAGARAGAPEVKHEDQVTPIGRGSPHVTGEVVHVVVTGLGPADRPVRTGELSPAGPLAHVPNVTCASGGSPLDLHYAGLAPGEIGVYRISLRIGAPNLFGFTMTCRVGDSEPASVTIP